MPNWNHIVRARLALLRLQPERENEIVEEVALHLEALYDEALAAGCSQTEAQASTVQSYDWRLLECELRRTEYSFAASSLSLELIPQTGGMRMESFWHDLRYGVRTFRHQPGFALLAVLTLSLGIGATTALFSVVYNVLLRALPYRDEARLVTLWQNNLSSGIEREEVSPANFFDWRERMQSCDIVAAAEPFGFNLSGEGEPETFRGWIVTQGFLEALGATPMIGRAFLPNEYAPGQGQVVVIGYALWQRRFGGDPGLVGRKLTLNNQPYTVIGVLPPEFQYPPGREIWVPRMPRDSDRQVRAATFLRVIGRLQPGSSLAAAQAEMNNIAGQLAHAYPQTNANAGAAVLPLRDVLTGRLKRALLVLLAAVGCLLLIACVNVASLQLARLTQRTRELAIRTALGASGSRLLRQLTIESVVLALLGGIGGILLARWLTDAMLALSPGDLPYLPQAGLHPVVLCFAFGVSLLTALVFGLVPAWQMLRHNVATTLKTEGRGVSGGRSRLRNALVVSQIALALLLLTGAGLLARSFIRLLQVNPGFVTARALTLETMIGRGRTPEQRTALVAQMHERVMSLPSVQAAAVSSALPFHDNQVTVPTGFQIEGSASTPAQTPTAYVISITPEYLTTMGIPLLQGRALTRFDTAENAPVALINQALAARHWPLEQPVGKRVTLLVNGKPVTCEIVGVAGDVLPQGYDSAPRPEIYLPYAQSPASLVTWVIRTTAAPAEQTQAVKAKLREANPAQAFLSIATLDQLADRTTSQRRFNLWLLGAFAGLALLLAGVGLYGTLSFLTAQRTQEFGIRLALGAQPPALLRLVLWQGLRLALPGIALGLVGALALTRLLQSLLFKLHASDPLTLASVVVLLLAVALLACWLPARRATKVDPLSALRQE